MQQRIKDAMMTWRSMLCMCTPLIFIDQSGSTQSQDGKMMQAIAQTARDIGTFFLAVGCKEVRFIPFSGVYIEVRCRNVNAIVSPALENGVPHACTNMYHTILDVLTAATDIQIPCIVVLSDGYDDNYKNAQLVLQQISQALSKFITSIFCIIFFGCDRSQHPVPVKIHEKLDCPVFEYSDPILGTVDPSSHLWMSPICLNRDQEHKHLCKGCMKRTEAVLPIYYYNRIIREDFGALMTILKTCTQVHLFYSNIDDPINGTDCVLNSMIAVVISLFQQKYCTKLQCYKIQNNEIREVCPSRHCKINVHVPIKSETKYDVYAKYYILQSQRPYMQGENFCVCGSWDEEHCQGSGVLPHLNQIFQDMCTRSQTCRYKNGRCRQGSNHDFMLWQKFFRLLLIKHNRQLALPIKIDGFSLPQFPTLNNNNWQFCFHVWQTFVLLRSDGTHRSKLTSEHTIHKSNFSILPYEIVMVILSYLAETLLWKYVQTTYRFTGNTLHML